MFDFPSRGTLSGEPAWGTLPVMGRRSRLSVLMMTTVVLVIVVLAVVLRRDLRCAGFAGPGVTAAELPAPAAPGRFRIATWNLRNFPLDERPQYPDLGYSRRTNICDLETALAGLDADVIGFAEITDARRFPPIVRRSGGDHAYRVALSRHGGGRAQRLAIAWDEGVLDLVGTPVEIREVAVNEGLRPAFSVTLQRFADGLDFTVVQVHLKSRREGFSTRRQQHRALISWIERSTEAGGLRNLMVMGDFNCVGSDRGGARRERRLLDRLYADAGLIRVPNLTGCSEYWEGGGAADGVQLPSLIDLVYIRGFDGAVPEARSWLHCARAGCNELVSWPGDEDGTFWDVSDHCPVTFEIQFDR